MKRIGVTGHQSIPASGLAAIDAGLRSVLHDNLPFVLLTSLAAGADQLAAGIALEVGGQIEAVLPSQNYRSTLQGEDVVRYDQLLAAAAGVVELPYDEPSEEAFYAAGLRVLDLSDVMVAVWDGEPAKGLGGTADIVNTATRNGVEVHVIWPRGLRRE